MVERIKALNLYMVFEPLVLCYSEDRSKFNTALFYILHVYSRESKFIISDQDFVAVKRRVIDRLVITDSLLTQQLMELHGPVLITVQRYLKLQMSKTLEHLMMKRELYQQMLQSAMDNITDANGIVMYDQKKKNSDYADRLYDEINEWEQRLLSEHKELRQAVEEIREIKKKNNRSSLRIEDVLNESDDDE